MAGDALADRRPQAHASGEDGGEGVSDPVPVDIVMPIGVRVLIIDRHAGPSLQTRALGVQARTLEEVIDRLIRATFDQPTSGSYEAEVKRAEERVLVDRLMWLAAVAPNAQVRAITSLKLNRLAARAGVATPGGRSACRTTTSWPRPRTSGRTRSG